VYRYLRRHGVPHPDAEDLAQEVLVAAFMHSDAVKAGKLHAWLRAVAHNKLIDRARRADNRTLSVAKVPDTRDSAPLPDEIVIGSASRQILLDALGLLPARDQRIVRLRYLEERSVQETAQATGMTVGAAKVALLRARAKLRDLIGKTEGDIDG
jgi:RNA polymerase sigma-70 factor, ECF subfamily